MRTAMHVEDDGVLLVGIEIGWLEQPGLDAGAIPFDVEALPLSRSGRAEERGVVGGDDLPLASLTVVDNHFADRLEAGERLCDKAVRTVQAEANAHGLRATFARELAGIDVEAVETGLARTDR